MGIDFTGKIRYKKGIFGAVYVQLEYRYQYSESSFNENDAEDRLAWLDATGEYLMQIDNTIPVV